MKVTVVSNAGKEAVITVLGAGDFFGEGCLAGQQLRMSTATAMTECSIMRLERGTVMEMLQTEPAFADLLLSYMLTHAIRTEENLIDQLFNSCEKRLARALLLLANFGKEGKPETVIPKISQEVLAGMVGTTRSRVSFFGSEQESVEAAILCGFAKNDELGFKSSHSSRFEQQVAEIFVAAAPA